MILSHDNRIGSDDPKLIAFHNTRGNPKEVICVRDNPFMHGFGPTIKSGEKVTIDGTVSYGNDFLVCIPDKCANYDYTAFEMIPDVTGDIEKRISGEKGIKKEDS